MSFTDAAAIAGVAYTKGPAENYRHASPAFADLDGDADLDIIVPGLDGDPTLVFENQGDGTFEDVSEGSGLDLMRAEFSMSTALGDYDLDGDLDVAFGHWGTPRDYVNGVGDTEHLWRNDSSAAGIRFSSVSIESGIAPSVVLSPDPRITQRSFDHTFTPTFADINDDGYPDLLMVGDFNFSQVFINNGDGSFRNETDYDVIIDGNGMGSAVGDYDGDGDLDWFVSSINASGGDVPSHISRIGNRLYRNNGGVFEDATEEAGVSSGGWGWGSCFVDFENDGDLDIYQTNGWPEFAEIGGFPRDLTRAFESDGQDRFTDRSEDLGLADTEQGRGVVCADFDGDGDVDVLQMHGNSENAATLYENTSDSVHANNYLSIDLTGSTLNTAAIGARIEVLVNGVSIVRPVLLGSNFASHNPVRQFFGLGASTSIEELRVRWPDGRNTVVSQPPVNQVLMVEQPPPDGEQLLVSGGSGGGNYAVGEEVAIKAADPVDPHYSFSHWSSDTGVEFADRQAASTTIVMPTGAVAVTANYLPGASVREELSVARRWNEVLLQGDKAGLRAPDCPRP